MKRKKIEMVKFVKWKGFLLSYLTIKNYDLCFEQFCEPEEEAKIKDQKAS